MGGHSESHHLERSPTPLDAAWVGLRTHLAEQCVVPIEGKANDIHHTWKGSFEQPQPSVRVTCHASPAGGRPGHAMTSAALGACYTWRKGSSTTQNFHGHHKLKRTYTGTRLPHNQTEDCHHPLAAVEAMSHEENCGASMGDLLVLSTACLHLPCPPASRTWKSKTPSPSLLSPPKPSH